MENLIGTLIAPAVMLILGWLLSKQDKLGKLVQLLQEEINRLNSKVIALEERIDTKDKEIERKNIIIAECYACRVPSAKCPALKMQSYFNHLKLPINGSYNNTTTDANHSVMHGDQTDSDSYPDQPP